jgi:hypothetical protein
VELGTRLVTAVVSLSTQRRYGSGVKGTRRKKHGGILTFTGGISPERMLLPLAIA